MTSATSKRSHTYRVVVEKDDGSGKAQCHLKQTIDAQCHGNPVLNVSTQLCSVDTTSSGSMSQKNAKMAPASIAITKSKKIKKVTVENNVKTDISYMHSKVGPPGTVFKGPMFDKSFFSNQQDASRSNPGKSASSKQAPTASRNGLEANSVKRIEGPKHAQRAAFNNKPKNAVVQHDNTQSRSCRNQSGWKGYLDSLDAEGKAAVAEADTSDDDEGMFADDERDEND